MRKDFFLALHIVIKARLGKPKFLRDHLERGSFVASLSKHMGRDGKDFLLTATHSTRTAIGAIVLLLFHKLCSNNARFYDILPQAIDALTIGILRLAIAQLRFITHANMPLAERQPNLSLVERPHPQPLAETLLPQHPTFSLDALTSI